jgi:Domain of unknown function (DUF4388)
MPGLSKVIVLDPDVRAGRQVQLGFEREGVPTTTIPANTATLELPGDDTGLVVVGGVDGHGLDLVRRSRAWLDGRRIDAPIIFAGRGVERGDAEAAGADEVVLQPAYLRDVVTIGRLLLGLPSRERAHLAGTLAEVTGVFTLVRALAAMGRSATLSLNRGLRRGEIRFYHGEVTSAQVGMIHGQAALHQLLLWTDARFDFHHEDIVRRQQIPLTHDELFADAERFLESVRDSSGGLSPSMVLEQDIERVQSFGKQIPTEVYGVLRMFDGHRVLADVLEDSAYRVFETLRVAQRAVEVGLLRVINKQPQRVSWRAVLSIEEWLVGGEARETGVDSGPVSTRGSGPVARESGPTTVRDPRGKPARKPRRNKKKRRVDTPPAIPIGATAAKQTIDWGALVPRIVGAEVGPLAGVVPAAHVSGEIVATAPLHARSHPETQPKVVFDEAAELARHATAEAERAAAEATAAVEARRAEAERADAEATAKADAERAGAEAAEADAHAHALRVIAATVSTSSDPSHVADDLELGDTKPERLVARAKPAEAASVIVEDSVMGESGAITVRVTAPPVAPGAEPVESPEPVELTEPPEPPESPSTAVPQPTPPGVAAVAAVASAPAEITDEPSDGVIRQHITSADTAPVKRRRPPSIPPEDDRPDDAMGEITTPRARPVQQRHPTEPSILVADLAAIHAAVSAIADEQAAAPATIDAAAPSHEVPLAEARSDAVAFSELEEAFFRAGHEKAEAVVAAPPTIESFDDLDEGYQPVGFWDRLRGKPARAADAPVKPDEPEPKPEPEK